MKWLDLDYPLYILLRLKLWWKIPNKKQRRKVLNENRQWAHDAVEAAIRREKWMAEYENRPERSIKQITAGLIDEVKRGLL